MSSLSRRQLSLLFFVTLSLTLFMPVLAPGLNLIYFAPFLIVSYYQKKLLTCLWYALGCGLVLDLLSAEVRIGFFALSFCLTTVVLYRQKQYFFADNASTLPIMTFFFSFLATVVHAVLANVLAKTTFFSMEWVATDLLLMPAADALYALAIFVALPKLIALRTR